MDGSKVKTVSKGRIGLPIDKKANANPPTPIKMPPKVINIIFYGYNFLINP
jgi:hypothetical protein